MDFDFVRLGDGQQAAQNTDREIWRLVPESYYSPSIHVTQGNGIGMNVGGHVIVMPIETWHALAAGYIAGRKTTV